MPSVGLNHGTVPGHPRLGALLSQQSVEGAVRLLLLVLRLDGYGEIANLATSFPPSTRRKDGTHMPAYSPTHLPTKLSRACRVYGGPVEGCKCNCRVQGAYSDAGADPGTFRHTILGIETKPSSRSITLQTLKDPAAVAVITTPTLARSLTCFAWLFSQAVRLESFSADPRAALAVQGLLFPDPPLPKSHARNVTAEVVVIPRVYFCIL